MMFDTSERAAVLAGLRMLLTALESENPSALPADVREILAVGGSPPLRERQLEELCERVFHDACKTPTVVLKTYCAPVVNEVFADAAVNVVFLDEDTEGCEPATVGQVEGEEVWIGRFRGKADPDRVGEVLSQVASADRNRAQPERS